VWKIQSELTAVYILMIKKKVIKEITNKIKKKKKACPCPCADLKGMEYQ
jgi:hypothetical protein